MKAQKKRMSTETLVLGAILTALVIVLQIVAANVRLGPCTISLAQVPIIIGVALCGATMGAWLGLIFGVMVLIIPGASDPFFTLNPLGTIATVIAKGVACGYIAGLVYHLFAKRNKYVAVIIASIVCPVVNTGIFFIGCLLFFMKDVSQWAMAKGFSGNIVGYMFVALAGFNFLFELGSNLLLNPVIMRLLKIKNKDN